MKLRPFNIEEYYKNRYVYMYKDIIPNKYFYLLI